MAVFLLAAILAGCGEDDGPTKPPAPVAPTYPMRSTPQNALESLRLAYQARDSVETDSVYHVDYHGESSTAIDPIGSLIEFTKSEEVGHVGALRKNPSVTNIVVNLGTSTSWQRGASLDVSHPEWASITISNGIRVELAVGPELYTVGNDDFFEYHFAPTTPAASSPTDTLWQVVRWREIKGAGS